MTHSFVNIISAIEQELGYATDLMEVTDKCVKLNKWMLSCFIQPQILAEDSSKHVGENTTSLRITYEIWNREHLVKQPCSLTSAGLRVRFSPLLCLSGVRMFCVILTRIGHYRFMSMFSFVFLGYVKLFNDRFCIYNDPYNKTKLWLEDGCGVTPKVYSH